VLASRRNGGRSANVASVRIFFDHVSDDQLLELHRDSLELREQAFNEPGAPSWVRDARAARHDEIIRELLARELIACDDDERGQR